MGGLDLVLVFSGITQVYEIIGIKEYTSQKYLQVMCTHNKLGRTEYDGNSPFDCFQITIKISKSQDHLINEIKEGTILHISSGELTSFSKTGTSMRFWNVRMATEGHHVKIILQRPAPPDYEPHLRSNGDQNAKPPSR